MAEPREGVKALNCQDLSHPGESPPRQEGAEPSTCAAGKVFRALSACFLILEPRMTSGVDGPWLGAGYKCLFSSHSSLPSVSTPGE